MKKCKCESPIGTTYSYKNRMYFSNLCITVHEHHFVTACAICNTIFEIRSMCSNKVIWSVYEYIQL